MDKPRILECLRLFDLPDSFSASQLKQAYRDLVQVWHPDKHSHNDRLRLKAEEKMKEINEAYEFLQSCLISGEFHFDRSEGSEPGRSSAQHHDAPSPGHQTSSSKEPTSSNSSNTARETTPTSKGDFAGCTLTAAIAVSLVIMLIALVGSMIGDKKQPSAPAGYTPSNTNTPEQTPNGGSTASFCRALDEKNGFKALKFGMTLKDTLQIVTPDEISTNEPADQLLLVINRGPMTQLGDFTLDKVSVSFFHGVLFELKINFSTHQEDIFKALEQNFGEPTEKREGWSYGGSTFRFSTWSGEKVVCTIVAPGSSDPRTGWNTILMWDQQLSAKAKKYAEEEPVRALEALNEAGFGEITLGMTLEQFKKQFVPCPRIQETEFRQKFVEVLLPVKIKLGSYPLSRVRIDFYQDILFKITLCFDENQEQIYSGFTNRFPAAVRNETWTRGKVNLVALEHVGQTAAVAILGPKSEGTTQKWDSIILYHLGWDILRQDFEKDASKRAAKDL